MPQPSRRLRRLLGLASLAALAGLGLLACLTPIWAYDTLALRHQRAYQRWTQRQPRHYRYELRLSSPLIYRHFWITVRDGELVQLNNAQTGIEVRLNPNSGNSNMPGFLVLAGHLLIEDLFGQIRASTVSPHSVRALASRSSPGLYATLVGAGWLADGWQGCQPAYPSVRYDPVYGYPQQLQLFGFPCTNIPDLSVPIRVQIEDFQVLP